MNHPDKYKARRFDSPSRCTEFTDIVYKEVSEDTKDVVRRRRLSAKKFDPPAPELKAFVGEMHGHTNLSDGIVDIDSYFKNIRDIIKLDFAAISDHDHGGTGLPTLWMGSPTKWDVIKEKVKEYNDPGTFSTILAYERDSYPFYDNMVIYYRDHDGELIRGVRDGEMTEQELQELLSRDDVIAVPHDTYSDSAGTDFMAIDPELILPMIEIYSRGDPTEYMGNPGFVASSACEGGFWQDALRRGAKMGVIAGSDDHVGKNGWINETAPYSATYPGVTGVWATENTPAAIFDAVKAKRTYAFMLGRPEGEMQGRMEIDFRINGHYMGETISRPETRDIIIYFNVKSDVPVKSVTLVKNCRNYIYITKPTNLIFDYKQETLSDHYYLRVELQDGRFGWTSPIWVEGDIN